MKILTFFLPCVILLLSCGRHEVSDISSVENDESFFIDLSEEPRNTLDLDTIVSLISFTKLQSTENRNSVLVNFDKVLIKDSLIYILDREFKGLKVYHLDGNFVRMIGSIGQGPGEYTYLNDFSITNDTILILTGAQQIISYNINGDYINTREIGRFADNFATDGRQFYFFMNYNVDPKDDVSYNLEITDRNFDLIARGAKFDEKAGNVPSFGYTGFLQEKFGEIWFSEAFDNKIRLIRDRQLISKYVFNFGIHGKSEDLSPGEVSEKQLSPAHLGKEYFENKRYFIFNYFINPKLRIGVYDKINNEFYDREKFVKNYKSLLFRVPKASLNKDEFISIVPLEFLIHIKRTPALLDYIEKSDRKLFELISNYSDSDNPLLVRYKFIN